LFGRMHGGAGDGQAVGAFINTLPVRVDAASLTAEAGVLATHRMLTDLIRHEHAPLTLAQRCSMVPAGT
ncbi:hypothetical protein, partial [Streptomyces sp. NRRL S-813]|uniref:hypothetical protein n=1 Tax=Streptomyces sp. NRRL S-813 TaxID=1463919 RepID=UPI00055FC5BF